MSPPVKPSGLTRQEATIAGAVAGALVLTGGLGVLFARRRRANTAAAPSPPPALALALDETYVAHKAVHGLVYRAVEL